MQKPFFPITAETKLINQDFVKIEVYKQPRMYEFSYFAGGKVYYAINTKEIVGFDFENLCILFKNQYPLFLYEDYKISKKEYIKLNAINEKTQYEFFKSSSTYFSNVVLDRLKNDYGCTECEKNIILPKTNAVISKVYELHFLGWAYRLFNPRTAFNQIVEKIKDILQEEIDEENKQIDIDNERIDCQHKEWKVNKAKAQETMKYLAELTKNN